MNSIDETEIIKELNKSCSNISQQIHDLQKAHRITLSQISHEIRNPVTLISSSLQIIEKEHPEVRDYALWQNVISDVKFLCQLLEELSAYNNGSALNRLPIPTEEWLYEIASSIETLSTAKNISFSYYIETPLPELNGDSIKLRQAILNLLRNSCEALCDAGKVDFTITRQGENLCIEIKDNGCGIDEETMKDIYKPFITHKADGSGLGLSIAKRIIEAHKGKLSCVSQKGCGTVFSITLPFSTN